MNLIDRISTDIAAAMRAKNQATLAPLRMAKAALMNREVEKGRPLDEAESQQVIASLIKQRRDSIEQFTKGGRSDLASREEAEIVALESYLPPPISAAELEREVQAAVAETGGTTPKDMGRVMKAVMNRLAGRTADGRVVSELVRKRLGG
ncbi:MAG: GatB/YqeY domain-containing protein [Vicinamibacterales bacterium]